MVWDVLAGWLAGVAAGFTHAAHMRCASVVVRDDFIATPTLHDFAGAMGADVIGKLTRIRKTESRIGHVLPAK